MRNLRFTKVQIEIIAFLTLFLLTPFLIPIDGVEAASETVLKVEPPVSFARVCETFTVNLTVANVQNLYGVEVALYWNASILKVGGVDVRLAQPDGVLYEPLYPYENKTFQDQGKYVLSCSSTAPAPSFNGSGNIVRITFNVTGVGSCELNLETKLASNIIPPGSTHVALIAHTTVGGFFGPIQIIAVPKTVIVGENVNISGFVSQAQANISVTILHRSIEEAEWQPLETVKTDERGSYTYIWKPEKGGKYYVKSTATILGHQEESTPFLISVNEPEPLTWFYISILVSALIISVIVTTFILYRKRTHRRRKKP